MKFRRFKLQMLFILLSGYLPLAISQQIEVTASKPDYNFASTSIQKIFGHDRDHFYVLKFHGSQYFLEKLNKDLDFMLEEPIKLNDGLKTYQLETVCNFYNDLYLFLSRRRFNHVVLYYQRIDKGNLKPSGDLTPMTTIEFINGNWPDFHFALSRHETKFLIACHIKPPWSKVQFNEYYVFGEHLDLIWKRKDSFEFQGQGPRDNKYIVDETGNISILSLQKRESLLSLFNEIKNSYTIYRYTSNGKEFHPYPVAYKNMYIRGIKIIAGENGDLFCAGLYSELYRKGVRGSFFFRIDANGGEIYDNRLNEFNDALIAHLSEIKEPIIAKAELIDYIMTDLVLRENGKIIFIAEQFYEQSYNTYNNLLVISYDTTGNVFWTQVIEKNQDFNVNTLRYPGIEPSDYRDFIIETGSLDQNVDNYCSYALMAPLTENSIILFFNDAIKNLEQPGLKKNFTRPRKSYILSVTIDEYGNITRKPVLTWKKKALFPEPLRFYDTRYNTIVIPAFKRNKYNYYKITASF
jgi:hypothetical protein